MKTRILGGQLEVSALGLAAALDDAGGRAAFDALAPSVRNAHVTNVDGAKSSETRARRIAAIIAKL